MKQLFTLFIILVLSFTFATQSQAQSQVGASVGLTIPFVDFGDAVESGFGGSLIFKQFVSDHIALGGNIGYYNFPGRELDFGILGSLTVAPDINIIPITASAELFIGNGEEIRPRIGLDFGMYIIGSNAENDTNKAYFGFTPVIGSGWRINGDIEVFADAKFQVILTQEQDDIPTTSYLSINAGVMINIGN